MHLTELLAEYPSLSVVRGATDRTVTQITSDSRAVQTGGLFFALKGHQTDGHKYIEEAVKNGAVVIVTDGRNISTNDNISVLASEDSQADYARLCSKIYPSRPAILTAVTGTNGKTSVCEYLRQIWSRATWPSASIGTLGVTSDIETLNNASALLTTPPPEQLFALWTVAQRRHHPYFRSL